MFTQYRVHTLPRSHYTVFTAYRVHSIPCSHYSVFILYRVYTIPCSLYTVFTPYRVHTILCLHYIVFTPYRVGTMPFSHHTVLARKAIGKSVSMALVCNWWFCWGGVTEGRLRARPKKSPATLAKIDGKPIVGEQYTSQYFWLQPPGEFGTA